MNESEFIVVPKKDGAVECIKHLTISTMSQSTKIVLEVLGARLKSKMTQPVDESHHGFGKGRGTDEVIFILRVIMERAIEKQKDLYMCSTDLEYAFDSVKHSLLVGALKRFGVDDKDKRVITRLYWQRKTAVRVGDETSERIEIKQGV